MTAPEAVPVAWDSLADVGELVRTQDNRITSHPLFAVEQKRLIGGVDPDYGGEVAWVSDGVEVTDAEELAQLEAQYREDFNDQPEGYRRTGKLEIWEFVTACFTEQGCKDYLALNGDNLRSPRIYAHSAYRNNEWQRIRAALAAAKEAPNG